MRDEEAGGAHPLGALRESAERRLHRVRAVQPRDALAWRAMLQRGARCGLAQETSRQPPHAHYALARNFLQHRLEHWWPGAPVCLPAGPTSGPIGSWPPGRPHRCHICTETGLTPDRCICAGTGLTPDRCIGTKADERAHDPAVH